MSDIFPSSKIDALTMLYLEHQDLSGMSPENLLDRYDDIHRKLADYDNEKIPQTIISASVNKCQSIPSLQALQYASITDCFDSYGHLNDVSVNINNSWRKRSLSEKLDNLYPRSSFFANVRNLCFIRPTSFSLPSIPASHLVISFSKTYLY